MTLRNAAKDFRKRVDPLAYERLPYMQFDTPPGGGAGGARAACNHGNRITTPAALRRQITIKRMRLS